MQMRCLFNFQTTRDHQAMIHHQTAFDESDPYNGVGVNTNRRLKVRNGKWKYTPPNTPPIAS